ncbi:HalOD1 output domain-containing protein [Halomicrobium urmianum]|uniref:HalOD1 output domain-containing protein n=1 Tax=Halomicrobium urmianum TaxID=1586233 RepID=UPI001CD9E0EF|nr:HalOD1 output domain-containing protein [Halomicrobium urmianum]
MAYDDVQSRGSPGGSRGQGDHRYEYHEHESAAELTTTLVHALADVMGRDVSDVEWRLSDSVDPDALDRLFSTGDGTAGGDCHVAFAVEGYRVTVYGNGEIVITPPERPPR